MHAILRPIVTKQQILGRSKQTTSTGRRNSRDLTREMAAKIKFPQKICVFWKENIMPSKIIYIVKTNKHKGSRINVYAALIKFYNCVFYTWNGSYAQVQVLFLILRFMGFFFLYAISVSILTIFSGRIC